ncbi:MAG: flavodoxin family protein [Treponema sp.]|jgi:multimeric flavodoxin WrbA|nr:flavodoxin family protein [Treponema sp.]
MKAIGINGSPRKGWNTDLMVQEALKGAASKGAETELIHLYDLTFKGCVSCFECKRKDGPSLGHCAHQDDLTGVLKKGVLCDLLILGSPIYLGEVTAGMRAFIERFTFQYITYRKDGSTFNQRRIPTGFIYTMNVSEELLTKIGYDNKFKFYEDRFNQIIGPSKTVYATETWQTRDYSKYEMSMFDEAERKQRHETVFPVDLKRAFDMAASLV